MTPEQERKLNEIYTALVGNPNLGTEGIVPRIKKLEAYQSKDKAFKNRLAGGVAVGTPVAIGVFEWIKSLFD